MKSNKNQLLNPKSHPLQPLNPNSQTFDLSQPRQSLPYETSKPVSKNQKNPPLNQQQPPQQIYQQQPPQQIYQQKLSFKTPVKQQQLNKQPVDELYESQQINEQISEELYKKSQQLNKQSEELYEQSQQLYEQSQELYFQSQRIYYVSPIESKNLYDQSKLVYAQSKHFYEQSQDLCEQSLGLYEQSLQFYEQELYNYLKIMSTSPIMSPHNMSTYHMSSPIMSPPPMMSPLPHHMSTSPIISPPPYIISPPPYIISPLQLYEQSKEFSKQSQQLYLQLQQLYFDSQQLYKESQRIYLELPLESYQLYENSKILYVQSQQYYYELQQQYNQSQQLYEQSLELYKQQPYKQQLIKIPQPIRIPITNDKLNKPLNMFSDPGSCVNYINTCNNLFNELKEISIFKNITFHIHDVPNMGNCQESSHPYIYISNININNNEYHIFVMNERCATNIFKIISLKNKMKSNNSPFYIFGSKLSNYILDKFTIDEKNIIINPNLIYLITENKTECDDRCIILMSILLNIYGNKRKVIIHSNDNYDKNQHEKIDVLQRTKQEYIDTLNNQNEINRINKLKLNHFTINYRNTNEIIKNKLTNFNEGTLEIIDLQLTYNGLLNQINCNEQIKNKPWKIHRMNNWYTFWAKEVGLKKDWSEQNSYKNIFLEYMTLCF